MRKIGAAALLAASLAGQPALASAENSFAPLIGALKAQDIKRIDALASAITFEGVGKIDGRQLVNALAGCSQDGLYPVDADFLVTYNCPARTVQDPCYTGNLAIVLRKTAGQNVVFLSEMQAPNEGCDRLQAAPPPMPERKS